MSELTAFENEVRKRLGLSAIAAEDALNKTAEQNHLSSFSTDGKITADDCEMLIANFNRLAKEYSKSGVVAFEREVKNYTARQNSTSGGTVQFNF